jgi:hypothetical protein
VQITPHWQLPRHRVSGDAAPGLSPLPSKWLHAVLSLGIRNK